MVGLKKKLQIMGVFMILCNTEGYTEVQVCVCLYITSSGICLS